MGPLKEKAVRKMDWRVIAWVGVSDIVLGLGLMGAGALGLLGEGRTAFLGFGTLLVLMGTAIVIWARNKMSQGDALSRRRD
jgi:hypothetical protein